MLRAIQKKIFGINIIIFGKHVDSWNNALAPASMAWSNIPNLKKISVVDLSEAKKLAKLKNIRPTIILPLLEEHIENCPKKFSKLTPSTQALETFRDKQNFYHYCKQNNLIDYCPIVFEEISNIQFPCVLKRVNLNAGAGIVIAKNLDELLFYKSIEPWKDQICILQEYIPGAREYVLHCICDRGEVLWDCTYSYDLSEETIKTAETVLCMKKIETSTLIIKNIEKFLLPLKYSGPCNIDYKINSNGDLKVFEINPRFGGSLMLGSNIYDLKEALKALINSAH